MAAPADEPGWCVTTVADLSTFSGYPGGCFPWNITDLGGGKLLFVGANANTTIHVVDTVARTFTLLATFSALFGASAAVDGTTWFTFQNSGVLGRVNPDLTIVNPWVTLPAPWVARPASITYGLDGNIYTAVVNPGAGDPVSTVFQITTGGVATEITALRDNAAGSSTSPRYTGIAADASGLITVGVRTPRSDNPYYNTQTVLRRATPAGGGAYTVADLAAQDLVDVADDGTTEAYAGLYCDSSGRVLAPMVTFQGGQHAFDNVTVMAVHDDGTVRWADEPLSTWDGSPAIGHAPGKAVAWNGSLFAAVANPAFTPFHVVQSSSDGINWTARASPFDDGVGNAAADCILWSPTFSKWFAGCDASTGKPSLISSPDLVTWTTELTGTAVNGLCDTGTQLVAVGEPLAGYSVATFDGITWTGRVTIAASGHCQCAATDGAGTVVAASGYTPGIHALWVSTDHGTTWASNAALDIANVDINAITWSAGSGTTNGWQACGDDGSLAYQWGTLTPAGAWTTEATYGAGAALFGIAVNPSTGTLIAVGAGVAGPFMATRNISSNMNSPVDNTVGGGAVFNGVCYASSLNLFVTVGVGTLASPDISWVLRVTPAGAVTRIAGTWSYTGTPPPPASGTNVADGPLNTSLICEIDDGCGISADAGTLWFVDDGDANDGITGNLLRKLTMCGFALGLRGGQRNDDRPGGSPRSPHLATSVQRGRTRQSYG